MIFFNVKLLSKKDNAEKRACFGTLSQALKFVQDNKKDYTYERLEATLEIDITKILEELEDK